MGAVMIDTRRVQFGLWSPDRATFIAVMAALENPVTGTPLATMVDGRLEPSRWVRIDEIGEVVDVPAIFDGEDVTTPAVMIPGHHVNLLAVGPLAKMLVAGLPAKGTIFETTRITSLLGQMDWKQSTVGEPDGYAGSTKVKIFDMATVATPARVFC